MIFVTVGTQLPFDRMISSLDNFVKDNGKDVEVFAQIGPSKYIPEHIEYTDFLTPSEADKLFSSATLIIGHAGMGSILTSLKYRKPIIVMPRRADLGEHRNDHQMATADWVKDLNGVFVAYDEKEFIDLLKQRSNLSADVIPEFAEEGFINFLKSEIE